MGSSKPPGTLGSDAGVVPVDEGTLVRSNSPPPRAVGAVPPAIATKAGTRNGGCPCSGDERTTLSGLDKVQSFSGDLPSPLQVMNYTQAKDEPVRSFVPDKEIRLWIKQAAEYHGVPHLMLAVILQQENAPGASLYQKLGQFAERSGQTIAGILDEALWDIVPDKLAGGSSGFANMKRATLRGAASYSERVYARKPIPDNVRFRMQGWDSDTRVPGEDWRCDLYYCAAHLRELIDRVTGKVCHNGALSRDQLEKVFASYNGSGKAAEKYGRDAINLLSNAAAGKGNLYFYEK